MQREIPSTYVPARNTIFLGLSGSLAEVVSADSIYVGFNAIDFSGYPDCRPQYVDAMAKALNLGTKRGTEGRPIAIRAPLLTLSKGEIVQKGFALGVPFELTWSCYAGGERPCGVCDTCLLRAKGFDEVGAPDPLLANAALTG
jgi:7-cyano-7-deazaguanine synthase